MKGGSGRQFTTSLPLGPADPADPLDPAVCSKLVFRVRETLLLTPEPPACMYLRDENKGSPFMENRRCAFGGIKAPAGAHLVAPGLDNTDSVYVADRNTDFVYIKRRNLCVRHRQCVYVRHINYVCNTYKLSICNVDFVSLRYILCL